MSGSTRRSTGKSNTIRGFLLYRIWYGEHLVYVGRTKQPLQDRIRGHLFAKPMHRTIAIGQVTKIEYAAFVTEADMNLYEIYFILKWHPPLNVDDKTRDYPTVELPDVVWTEFKTPLWEKWVNELEQKAGRAEKARRRYYKEIPQEMSVIRSLRRTGELDEVGYYEWKERLEQENKALRKELFG